MKLKLLSILMSLAVVFVVAGCDTADNTTAPEESVMTPDTTTPGTTDGPGQIITTFTVGLGQFVGDGTVSQAALLPVAPSPAGTLSVCGDGLTGCAYDPNAYGGTFNAVLNEVDASWTLTDTGGAPYQCIYVEFLGYDAAASEQGYSLAQKTWCGANAGAVAITGNTGPGNMQRSVPGPIGVAGSGTVDVTLGNVPDPTGPLGNGCHYKFGVIEDDAGCGLCGNGVVDVGEDCDPGAPQNDTCCHAGTCLFADALGLDPQGNCDNADVCDGAETCDGLGACAAGTPLVCDDGLACTGTETCDPIAGCQPGTPVNCDDGVACTDDSCSEPGGTCNNVPNNGNCVDDGQFCNGVEYCDAVTDCTSPGDPCLPLTCNEVPDTCGNCGDGVVSGAEDCDPGAPQNDTCCDPITCTFADALGNDPQGNCGNADVCDGIETCDGLGACSAGTPLSCDNADVCDGLETCDPVAGCQAGTPLVCDDGLACTGTETCDPVAGCQPGTPVVCDDLVGCTTDACTEPAGTCTYTPVDAACDDGFACTGVETCDALLDCQAGTPVNCDDGVGCTTDACTEPAGACTNTPVDAACDDGFACTGVETCDALLDCQAGTPVNCDDGVACTDDSCSEPGGTCNNVVNDGNCPDDGAFCNGTEFCDALLDCQSTGDPCAPGPCDEVGDTCPSPGFCSGTLDVTLEDGLGAHPSPGGTANSLNSNGGVMGQYSAYTAVVNNGPQQAAYGFAGSWVDKVRGTLDSSSACDGTEVITGGYSGTSLRTAVALDVSACDGSTTFSVPFSVDGPFIDLGQAEHLTGAAPVAVALPQSTTEDIIFDCDGTPVNISTTIYLADDGGIDENCSGVAGDDCLVNHFAYCADGGGMCFDGNPFGWNGFAEARHLMVYDTGIFSGGPTGTGNACVGTSTAGCAGLMDLGAGMDYVASLDPALTRCDDNSSLATLPANVLSAYSQTGLVSTNMWRGTISLGACPLNVGAAQAAGTTTVIDWVDISQDGTTIAFPGALSQYAWFVGAFGVPVVSADQASPFGPDPTFAGVNTAIATATVTFQ